MFATIIRKSAPLALAAAMAATTIAPAQAGPRERARNAGIIGAVAGALAVGAIASRRRAVRPRPVYVAPRPVYVAPRPVYVAPRRARVVRSGGWAGHVARCYAAYRSYDEATDTYQPYGNRPRRRCTK